MSSPRSATLISSEERTMKGTSCRVAAGATLVALLCGASAAPAQTAPVLGTARSFAVLAGSTVTNTGPSTITGDLGLSPGSAVTGFPPGVVVSGTIHAADAVALAAQNDVTTAYNSLAGQPCTQDLTGQDLGGKTLIGGVYCFSSSAQLTGTLTLDAQGSANTVFVFKIGSTLTTASGAGVVVSNGGSVCNVFWQVGASATLGSGTAFGGNLLALTSITLNTGASVTGRTLARNGAVTLDTNTVRASDCTAGVTCPAISLVPATLPTGILGLAYSQTISGNGGVGPYTFAVTAGALPAGLTLTTSGVLSGIPRTSGGFTITIRATDANGCVGPLAYTLIVANSAPTLPQWGVLILAGGLLTLGCLRLRRRSSGATRMS
jgi:hypothetical protein